MPDTLTLAHDKTLTVAREFENILVTLKHVAYGKNNWQGHVTDQATAHTLEDALCGVFNVNYPSAEVRRAIEAVRATEWGAELP